MARKTISAGYARQNQLLHAQYPNYGSGGGKWAELVCWLIETFAAGTLLDYGCGKQSLARALSGIEVYNYDPAIPGLDVLPCAQADLVVCTDVLEHVEPESIDAVLEEIAALTGKVAFLVIATRPAIKILPDGRNAHLLVEPVSWWQDKLQNNFEILACKEIPGHEFSILVAPRGAPAEVSSLEHFYSCGGNA